MTARRAMHLNLFQMPKSGHLPSSWRHASSEPSHAADLETLVSIAQLAESACFDSIFIADTLHLAPTYVWDETRGQPDGLILLSVIAARTERIGLIATTNTTFSHPYDLARKFATLDRLSGGRTGWNIVTGTADAEARNHGVVGLYEAEERYARATEFVEVAIKLWTSWDEGALVLDKATGQYADPTKVHAIDHEGRYYRSAGPLTVPGGPQVYPVLVQAGQSPPGRDFAARFAEVIFTAQSDLDEAREFALDIRSRAAKHGRDPNSIKILPGLIPILGRTEAEAEQLDQELRDLIPPALGFDAIKIQMGVDLTSYALDAPVPSDPDVLASLAVQKVAGSNISSRGQRILNYAIERGATIRELMSMAGSRQHLTVVGSLEQLADTMQRWFDAGACDGFNLAPSLFPQSLELFVSDVVPILRDRGLFRSEYTGTTLRDHLGLEAPVRPLRSVAQPVES